MYLPADVATQIQILKQFTSKPVDLVKVFATATFENSSNESLQQEELDVWIICNITTIRLDNYWLRLMQ